MGCPITSILLSSAGRSSASEPVRLSTMELARRRAANATLHEEALALPMPRYYFLTRYDLHSIFL
jgi:hypothetical protein